MKIQPNPNITPHFKLREFDCKDGSIAPAKYHANLIRLCNLLEDIRELFGGKPVDVTSGYRSPGYNDMLIKSGRKAAKNSKHMTCEGADFHIAGWPLHVVQAHLLIIFGGSHTVTTASVPYIVGSPDVSPVRRVELAANIRKAMRGLGLGAHQGFVHIDVREGKRAKWTY